MKCLINLFTILCISVAFSQTISKQIIGVAGKTLSNNNLKLSFTIGEPVIGIMTSGGNQLSNGFYPALDLQTLNIEDANLNLEVQIHPNPVCNSLYVSHPSLNSFDIQITDLNGKSLFFGIAYKDEPIDISGYSEGIYIITIQNNEKNIINRYKIIKK